MYCGMSRRAEFNAKQLFSQLLLLFWAFGALGAKGLWRWDHKTSDNIPYLRNFVVERMGWLQLYWILVGSISVCCLSWNDQNNNVGKLMPNAGWRMVCHPATQSAITGWRPAWGGGTRLYRGYVFMSLPLQAPPLRAATQNTQPLSSCFLHASYNSVVTMSVHEKKKKIA